MQYTHDREVVPIDQAGLSQGPTEAITYALLTTKWGGSPSNPVVTIFDSDDEDVTETVLDGSAEVEDGTDRILFRLHSMTVGKLYAVYIDFVSRGNQLQAFASIPCTTRSKSGTSS